MTKTELKRQAEQLDAVNPTQGLSLVSLKYGLMKILTFDSSRLMVDSKKCVWVIFCQLIYI